MSRGDAELEAISNRTVGHYQASAQAFWEGTRDHDVSQNRQALLGALSGSAPFRILDFGCGPGRDLRWFVDQGHEAVGLDGCEAFAEMAREYGSCEVLHQDFLSLDLPGASFDGVFANASFFHVPTQEAPRVLSELHAALRPGGVLFASNPRGEGQEGWNGSRYGSYWSLEQWRALAVEAGFEELHHYYRPTGKPRAEQPWLASVWRALG